MNSKINWIETTDAQYFGYIEVEIVNGSEVYVATICSRGFADDHTVTEKISTFYKYTMGQARRSLFQNLNHYNPAL